MALVAPFNRHWLFVIGCNQSFVPCLLTLLQINPTPQFRFVENAVSILSVEDFQNYHRDQLAVRYGAEQVTDAMVNTDVVNAMGTAASNGSGLSKALTSDSNIAIAGTVGGESLKIQDLTQTLANAELNSKDHAPLWNFLKQVPCDSDVVEMTQMQSYGRHRGGGYLRTNIKSGGLRSRDPKMEREVTPVRWTGQRWQTFTTLNSQRTLSFNNDPVVGGADQVNSMAAMESLILDNNYLGWHGNFSVNHYEPNGLIQQTVLAHDGSDYRTVTIIDLKGEPITPETLPIITKTLRAKGAVWTDFWHGNQTEADLEIMMESIVRSETGQRLTLGLIPEGQMVKAMGGKVGESKFHMDLMLDPIFPDDTFGADPEAPVKPTSVTGANSSAGSVTNPLGGKLPAGVYTYSVSAVGTNGRSDVRPIAASVTVNGSQKAVLTITNGADTAGDYSVDYFEIWRAAVGGTRRYLTRIPANGVANGATVTFEDKGEFVPGCSSAFAMSNRPNGVGGASWMIRMLHPIAKVILPQDVLANEAAYICGWTPQGLTRTHNVVIRNIGPLNGFGA